MQIKKLFLSLFIHFCVASVNASDRILKYDSSRLEQSR